ANRRSQAPTAAAAVKGPSAKTAATPATGSPASSILFGSFDDPAGTGSSSTPETSASSGSSLSFGSIPVSKKISGTKPEEVSPAPTAATTATAAIPATAAAAAPASATPVPAPAPQEPAQPPVSQSGAEYSNMYKPIPPHVPHPHMGHGPHNSHRRTDSTSSAHATEQQQHQYRAQAPPTISQGPMMPPMGVAQPGPGPYPSQRPPIKNQGGMGPMNSQGPPHGMHPQHPRQQQQQWSGHGYYVYDTGYYPQPMYTPQIPFVPARNMGNNQFNVSATPFTPPQPSRRIAIINPDTKAEVNVSPSMSSSTAPVAAEIKATKSPLTENKAPPAKNVIKIVNPADREREERERKETEEKARKEKDEKERLEREEKERLEREAKEAEERRLREEREEKERQEAAVRAEQERKEREERERKEREEHERKEQ
ncbi:hypothetical protein BGW38_006973, partial [Lunasporangiospora selenospora]